MNREKISEIVGVIGAICGINLCLFAFMIGKTYLFGIGLGIFLVVVPLSSYIYSGCSPKHVISFVFVVSGIFILTGSLLFKFGSEQLKNILLLNLPLCLGAGFGIIGVLTLLIQIISARWLKRICTQLVTAKCIGVDVRDVPSSSGRGHDKTFAPKFTYSYNGEEYSVMQEYHSTYCGFRKGRNYKLLINPDEPEVFCYTTEKSNRIIYVIAIGFIIFGVLSTTLIFIGSTR